MIFKVPSDAQAINWIVIGVFSTWGGLVRYLIDMHHSTHKWSWMGVISQIVISSFTGLLGGLLSFENGASHYTTYAASGLFGTMGSTALSYIWQRWFYTRKDKEK
ncbi:phage holin family protein [Serratia plymuthica]|uniref:phage holin family protein n=1 Tax=Serratia plymuthica TaxID=82996 RepID=UPI003DA4BBE2